MHKSTLRALLLTLGGVVLVGTGLPAHAAGAPTSTIAPNSAKSANQISLGGVVVPLRTIDAVSLVSGRVNFVLGSIGTRVTAGQVVVAVNNSAQMANLQEAQAELLSAQIGWQTANIQYTRQLYSPRSNNVASPMSIGPSGLFNHYFTGPFAQMAGIQNPGLDRYADTVQSKDELLLAEQRIRVAQAKVANAQSALSDTNTYAPFDGVIMSKQVEVGGTVQPGSPLLVLADVSRMLVKVDVPEDLVPSMRLGQPVPITIGRTELPGIIYQIYPLAAPSTHTVPIKIMLPPGAPVASGMYATITLPGNGADGVSQSPQVAVPETALIKGYYLPCVLVVNPHTHKTEIHVLRLGETLPHGMVVVLAGLKSGDQVVLHPPAHAASGWEPGHTPHTVADRSGASSRG